MAIPALEVLHEQWSSRLAAQTGYEEFRAPLQAGIDKLTEYYNKTEDSPAYIISMG